MVNKKTSLDKVEVINSKDNSELVVVDKDTGEQIPIKLALGKKRIKIENSLLYSVMLFGALSDDEINDFVRMNEGKLTQNDKISHYLYQQAGKHDKDAINALLELNLAIAKRDKTTIINFTPTQEQTSTSDSIIDKLEQELAEITEADVSNKQEKKTIKQPTPTPAITETLTKEDVIEQGIDVDIDDAGDAAAGEFVN